MTEEKEEEKVEEAPPIAFNPRAGEVADPKQNPLMNLFNIPSDNMQTLTQLHKELTRTIQKRESLSLKRLLWMRIEILLLLLE
jgi:hypothetical protein